MRNDAKSMINWKMTADRFQYSVSRLFEAFISRSLSDPKEWIDDDKQGKRQHWNE
jgi:hypothetical protein